MLLIVGLGNLGNKYTNTPHNAGFRFVDQLREYLGYDSLYSVDDWKGDKLFESEIVRVRNGNQNPIMLIKPTTFMNASGRAVKKVMSKFEVKAKDLVIVHDDLDLKLGEFKIQVGKGPKKHNGIHSVQNVLGTTDFLRVRIGVETRTPENRIPGEDFVLMPYGPEQQVILDESIAEAVKRLRSMVMF